jgi:hypothetical protein
VARLARLRHGLEPPDLIAGADVERGHPAIDAELVGRRTKDQGVLHDQRRDVELQTILVVEDGLVPDLLAGPRVDGDEMTVVGRPEHAVLPERDALHDHQVRVRLRRDAVAVGPERAAVRGVHRHDFAVLHDVHHAIDDNRRRFHLVEILRAPGPFQRQPADVVARDLVERAEPVTGIVAAVGQPVVRLALGVDDPLVRGALRRTRGRRAVGWLPRREIADDVGDLLGAELALVRRHQPVLDDRVLAQFGSRERLEPLVRGQHLDTERILVEDPADHRGAIVHHDAHAAVLGKDLLVGSDDGARELLGTAVVPDAGEIRSDA